MKKELYRTQRATYKAHMMLMQMSHPRFKHDIWGIYNSDFASHFKSIPSIKNQVYDKLKETPNPVVIDLFASTTAIRSVFEELDIKNGLGIAVSLSDRRSSDETKKDAKMGVSLVTGDLGDKRTWNEINARLQDRKADVITERAVGGLLCISRDPAFLRQSVRDVWRILSSEGGLIYAHFLHMYFPIEMVKGYSEFLASKGVFSESIESPLALHLLLRKDSDTRGIPFPKSSGSQTHGTVYPLSE